MPEAPVLSISGVKIEGEIVRGDSIAEKILEACGQMALSIEDGDVVVVTHKIVSKSEGRLVRLDREDPEARERLLEAESARILRRRGTLAITQTRHGFVCANAGVDSSNVEPGWVTLLPVDPDKSARRIRSLLRRLAGVNVSVIITDTFGRAWRVGQVNVAIGVAGMRSTKNYREALDSFGQVLLVTNIAVADEVAGAAELVMGKSDGVPVAILKGVPLAPGRGNARQLVRSPQEDLFL